MKLREYKPEDGNEVIKMFYDTIHSVSSADYTAEQLDAWAPKNIESPELRDRLSNTYSVVVEQDGLIIGFGNEHGVGYFDCLYTHKDYQRIGVASLIADDIEGYFFHQGIDTITTDASITAKPFFEKRGYVVLREQIVESRGQHLTNFKMQRTVKHEE